MHSIHVKHIRLGNRHTLNTEGIVIKNVFMMLAFGLKLEPFVVFSELPSDVELMLLYLNDRKFES